MIKIKILENLDLIEDACSLLYEEYIKTNIWIFSNDNPSKLKVITKNNRNLLVDRVTSHAIWFGAFDNSRMVGCIRLFKATENIPFEIELYQTAKEIVTQYIEMNKFNIYEASRACVDSAYKDKNILLSLYLGIAEFCQKEKMSIFGSTSNGYLKSVLRQIEWPCKKEDAFKFDETDSTPVNFYLADYRKSEISHMIEKIKTLENFKSNRPLDILNALHIVAPIFPAPMYWHDTEGIVLGINAQCLQSIDKSIGEVLGRTPYDFYPKEVADHIWQHSMQVIKSGETLSQEEYVYDTSGKCIGTYLAIKAPLYDEYGRVVGVLGTSINITAEKEAEQLKIENEKQRTLLEEEEKFTKLANQVAHDIRSPLASLLMIVKSCTQIPEDDRIALREAATSIGDIANHLLHQYQKNEIDVTKNNEHQALLVSTALLELLTSKKYQYQKLSIKFDYQFQSDTSFVFIKIDPSAFKRMISNLINNAVDALEKTDGKIILKLCLESEKVKVSLQDTGKGMPQSLIDKIMNKVSVTSGKESGHGLGLMQVWETLDESQGTLSIESAPKRGTTMTLTFSRMQAPSWIAEEIVLTQNDMVIILDDDASIHKAWRTRFQSILTPENHIQLKHFEQGHEALQVIHTLTADEKRNVFLLSDYELLKQDLTGLHIIAQSGIDRSILVTSHYANSLVQEQAFKTKTRILPKQLASEITIKILPAAQEKTHANVVIVDDDKTFARNLALFIFDDYTVDQYHSPESFLKNMQQYSYDTKIYLDNNYNNSLLKGLDIAEKLHAEGFKRLYLLTGEAFDASRLPAYLTVIRKDDIESIKSS